MSMAEYQAYKAVSRGFLVDMLRSPAYALYRKQAPEKATDAMNIGTALHTKVLEPELFDDQFLVAKLDRRTSEGKAAQAEAIARNLIILKPEEMFTIDSMDSEIKAHKGAMKLLQNGDAEQTVITEMDGVLCKIRMDYVRKEGIIIDVKTTIDASPEAFLKTIINYNYHIQAAFYLDVLAQTEYPSTHFAFIAVEKEAPFSVGVYTLDESFIELGRKKYKRALAIYKECVANNYFPAYSQELIELTPPLWALKQESNNE
jgi:hypothetical protein